MSIGRVWWQISATGLMMPMYRTLLMAFSIENWVKRPILHSCGCLLKTFCDVHGSNAKLLLPRPCGEGHEVHHIGFSYSNLRCAWREDDLAWKVVDSVVNCRLPNCAPTSCNSVFLGIYSRQEPCAKFHSQCYPCGCKGAIVHEMYPCRTSY